VDPWGSPPDLFTHGECHYTIAFLTAYLRYAFVHAHRPFTETMRVVELGSGAGTQAELLHKLYPRATILCFDLPLQGGLCQHHLRRVFGSSAIVPMEETVSWQDLSRVEPGRITVLPNWKMPLLADWPHDLFWNAASFGEMEPEVVSSYIRDFAAAPAAVYLQQAVGGKETTGSNRVRIPIMEADYDGWMPHHRRLARAEAWGPLVPVGSGDPYFQALWILLSAS
jgi:putative sugar O-methyltransferase